MLTRRLTSVVTAGLIAVAIAVTPLAAAASGADKLPANALGLLVQDITKAQTLSTGRGVTVAVVSTGVDPSDPGLAGKVTVGPDYTFPSKVRLSQQYGTAAASIIAARGPSGAKPLTALGIAPAARILSIRAYPQPNEAGSKAFLAGADFSELNAKAIDYAVSHGAQVIYVEDDTDAVPTPDLSAAVQRAVNKKVVIVAAAFTNSKDPNYYVYPAGLPGVIGVGSIGLAGGRPPYDKASSVRDNAIFIAAQQNPIYDSSNYGIDGPGAAAAIVAGAVALVKSLYPGLTVPQVELALARSAMYHPHGGYDTTIGFGLINPYGALQEAATLAGSTSSFAPGAATAGVAPTARLGGGPAPAAIDAVHHPRAKVIASAVAVVAGLVLLIVALIVMLRARRRRRRAAGGQARAAF